MRVKMVQVDGALPNLAIAKLAAWHRSQGDDVTVTSSIDRTLFDDDWDRVYGSAIFRFSHARLTEFQRRYPEAVIGGTGTDSQAAVEAITGPDWHRVDLSDWPGFRDSVGFTQRGCRMRCGFCVVPTKEGANRSVATIGDIWRGDPYPRRLHLLDNDFFGQPRDQWQARVAEIRAGNFRVCLSQGINVRLIDDEAAAALATIEYRDTSWQRRRLYTAWDNLGDEKVFMAGVDRLKAAGVPPSHLMTYMLVGYAIDEDWDRIWHRFGRMVDRGIKPYPMVFNRSRRDLRVWARWVLTGLYRAVPWDEYRHDDKSPASVEAWRKSA